MTGVPVEAVAADARGALAVPQSPHRLGWWALGAAAGAPGGTLLLAGHLDTVDEGVGVFESLHEVRPGTRAEVLAADGTRHRYVIVARRMYRQASLPKNLFTSGGTARLALVTCGGRFTPESGRYEENLVLYGVPRD
nr:class F sortase [Streptomyces scabichelini]